MKDVLSLMLCFCDLTRLGARSLTSGSSLRQWELSSFSNIC